MAWSFLWLAVCGLVLSCAYLDMVWSDHVLGSSWRGHGLTTY